MNKIKIEDRRGKIIEMEDTNKELSMKEKIDNIYLSLNNNSNKNKKKKLKLPRGSKIRKSKMKKGWCGIIYINETGAISGQKSRIEGGTYKTKDDIIHVTDGKEILMWEGKFPLLWQRHDKLNPTNLFPKQGDQNEVYGQKLVKLRMKSDAISEKKKGKIGIVYILIILGVGYFLLKTLFPSMFGA